MRQSLDSVPNITVDLRRDPRAGVYVSIDVFEGPGFWPTLSMDISPSGAFIVTDRESPVGTRLVCVIDLPNETYPLILQAEVRWSRGVDPAEPELLPGMGVAFLDVDESERARILGFLAQVR